MKTRGIVSIICSYVIWGLLPVYWKWVQAVPPDRMLAHRIVWSFVFTTVLLVFFRLLPCLRETLRNRRNVRLLLLAAIIVTSNWLTYIYAVNSGQIIASSLGYYINPLVSIAMGAIVYRERFPPLQIAAIILAAAGVAVMALSVGSLPWISLVLAFTFATYALLKKKIALNATVGLFVETGLITPVAFLYLLVAPAGGLVTAAATAVHGYPAAGSPLLLGLMPLAGVITAVPLMLFATGTRELDLSMVGFLQYIAPTLMLLLGVFVYGEPFTSAHAACFALIWTGLLLYTVSKLKLGQLLKRYRA